MHGIVNVWICMHKKVIWGFMKKYEALAWGWLCDTEVRVTWVVVVPRQGPCGYDAEDNHGYWGKGPWAVEVPRQGPYSYGIRSELGDVLKGELSLDGEFRSRFPLAKLRKSWKTHKVQRKKMHLASFSYSKFTAHLIYASCHDPP